MSNAYNSLGYSGKVTVKKRKGNTTRIIYDDHNTGLPALFKGLGAVLAGMANLNEVVPTKIGLYCLSEDSSITTSWDDLINLLKPSSSQLWPISRSDIISSADNATDSNVKVLLQSSIPFSSLVTNNVQVLVLFPAAAANSVDFDKALAVYTFKAEGSNEVQKIAVDRTSTDDNLIIEWLITLKNA